jgi:hypothetical protein
MALIVCIVFQIDGLRAVAVLAMLINHLDGRLLPGGFLGVAIFFMISGYVGHPRCWPERMAVASSS